MWNVVGCYILPNDASTIEDIIMVIIRRTRGAELPVVKNFDTNLADPERPMRTDEIAVSIISAGLEDMITNFLSRYNPWSRDGRTYRII